MAIYQLKKSGQSRIPLKQVASHPDDAQGTIRLTVQDGAPMITTDYHDGELYLDNILINIVEIDSRNILARL